MSKDYLKVWADGQLLDATLSTHSIPECEGGAAHKRYEYNVNGEYFTHGFSKREVLDNLIAMSREAGWVVYQKIS